MVAIFSTNPNLVGGSDGGARNDVAVTVGQEPAFQERKEESLEGHSLC